MKLRSLPATLACLVLFLVLSPLAVAQDEAPSSDDCLAITDVVQNSLVRVRYTLQFDKSEAPYGGIWGYGRRDRGGYGGGLDQYIEEERPAEASGFLISDTRVVTADPRIQSRFIKEIGVRFGDQTVKATPIAYGVDQSAVILELDRPLDGATPLDMKASSDGPYWVVTYGTNNGYWTTDVRSLPSRVTTPGDGRSLIALPSGCLIVDRHGRAAGMTMNYEIPADDSWKGSPETWRQLSTKQMESRLSELAERADLTVLRVALSFRSPKKNLADRYSASYYGDEEADETERNVTGVVVDESTILVLANLKPKVTARLERVRVYPASGDAVEASFVGTLKDYGAFVARVDEPLSRPAPLSAIDVRQFRNEVLMAAEVRVQGESRIGHYNHDWLTGFDIGWKEQIYPSATGSEMDSFLFSLDGELVVLPIAQRKKVTVEEEWDDSYPTQTAACYVRAVLDDLDDHVDPDNVPLTEEEESRLAWMGVELQALDQDLARANNVSDETNDGETGAIVAFVYPDSPASRAGVQMGDILLRLHVEGHPRPMEIQAGDNDIWLAWGGFPWDRLDELPEEAFDQVPPPWPTVENNLNRKLTDLGFGKAYTAEFFRAGQKINLDFKVTEGPAHYNSAARYENEAIGVTVRNLTYEIRRYFQQGDDEPGVVISKIEPGSKASVAGLKPYERITHVNDQPVMNVEEFEAAVAGQSELRLAVKRMTRGRIVKLSVESVAGDDEMAPAGGEG